MSPRCWGRHRHTQFPAVRLLQRFLRSRSRDRRSCRGIPGVATGVGVPSSQECPAVRSHQRFPSQSMSEAHAVAGSVPSVTTGVGIAVVAGSARQSGATRNADAVDNAFAGAGRVDLVIPGTWISIITRVSRHAGQTLDIHPQSGRPSPSLSWSETPQPQGPGSVFRGPGALVVRIVHVSHGLTTGQAIQGRDHRHRHCPSPHTRSWLVPRKGRPQRWLVRGRKVPFTVYS